MSMLLIKLSTAAIISAASGYSQLGWTNILHEVVPEFVLPAPLPVEEPSVAITWPDADMALVPVVDVYSPSPLPPGDVYDSNQATYTVTRSGATKTIPAVPAPVVPSPLGVQ